MLTKRTILKLGLVAGFVSLLTTPATAQEGPSVRVHRVCTIASGQDAGAVAFAREVADYIDETWPELQVVTFRPAAPPSNQIHWVMKFENMEAAAVLGPTLLEDSGYLAVLGKAEGLFDQDDPCIDTFFVNLRLAEGPDNRTED